MVVTDIVHIGNQVSMTTDLKKAIDFLQRPDIHGLADGRVDIDGQHLFALVQRYETIMGTSPDLNTIESILTFSILYPERRLSAGSRQGEWRLLRPMTLKRTSALV
ncbi:MAG: YhcH/YjgK/YiaL family protein [Nitrospirae bacterium]|nr:YhcH/YjgK/YiaL family protein [Nitrospirota bacterium]